MHGMSIQVSLKTHFKGIFVQKLEYTILIPVLQSYEIDKTKSARP